MGKQLGRWVVKWGWWVGQDARCGVFLVKGVVVVDFGEGSGSGSGTGRGGGNVHTGEIGYSTWAIMSPYGSEGTYWHAMLKLIHLDHGCSACVCLGAWGSQGYWQSSALPGFFKELKWLVCYHYHSKRDFPIPSRQRWHVSGRRPADSLRWKATSKLSLPDFSPSLSLSSPLFCLLLGPGGGEGECGWVPKVGVLGGGGGSGSVYMCMIIRIMRPEFDGDRTWRKGWEFSH